MDTGRELTGMDTGMDQRNYGHGSANKKGAAKKKKGFTNIWQGCVRYDVVEFLRDAQSIKNFKTWITDQGRQKNSDLLDKSSESGGRDFSRRGENTYDREQIYFFLVGYPEICKILHFKS